MIIQPATPADYPALADLWYDSWQSIGISNETDLSRVGVRQRFMREAADRWGIYLAELNLGATVLTETANTVELEKH